MVVHSFEAKSVVFNRQQKEQKGDEMGNFR